MVRNYGPKETIHQIASRFNRKVLSSRFNMVVWGNHMDPLLRINRTVADQFVFSRINDEGILFWPTANRELGSFWT